MQLHSNDKNKRKFQFFVNFTKKINDNDFSGKKKKRPFYEKAYNIFLVTFIKFKHAKVGTHIEYMRQKLSKNMLIAKLHLGMSAHTFFVFIPR